MGNYLYFFVNDWISIASKRSEGIIALMMEVADKTLIQSHMTGDPDAFAQIVRRYGPGLLGYISKINGTDHSSEDVFQETFKRVHEKSHTFKGDKLKPWIYRIATNIVYDRGRRSKRVKFVSLNTSAEDGQGDMAAMLEAKDDSCPDQQILRKEMAKKVTEAIDFLPKRQKAALVLSYYQQLSYPEVAEVMGCSVGTVKTQVFRALKSLAGKLPNMSGGAI
jgi:RNA polymerase sigma-70 factor (ECF subfamily)